MSAIEQGVAGDHLGKDQVAGQIVELFPKPELLALSVEVFNSSSREFQLQTLTTMRRRSYDPRYQARLQEIYPDGETEFPISPLEESVFDVMHDMMVHPDDELTDEQNRVLSLLSGIDPADATRAIREEDRVRQGLGRLTTRYEIGGYKMGRQIIRAIDQQIEFDRRRARSLREEVERFGTDAYLSPDDRGFLKTSVEEDELERKYKKDHPYVAVATAADMEILYKNGATRPH